MTRNIVALLAAGLLIACNGDDDSTDDVDTDTDTDTDSDTDTDYHPLIPEEYRFLWDADGGCETTDGTRGDQVYRYTFDAESNESGSFSATEVWIWLHDGPGWNGDCADTFEITGTWTTAYPDYCISCEEKWIGERVLTESTCGYAYDQIFGLEDPPDEPATSWDSLIALDTLNPNGDQNPDGNTLVHSVVWTDDGASILGDAADGTTVYLGDIGTYPAEYSWYGKMCVVTSEGGA